MIVHISKDVASTTLKPNALSRIHKLTITVKASINTAMLMVKSMLKPER